MMSLPYMLSNQIRDLQCTTTSTPRNQPPKTLQSILRSPLVFQQFVLSIQTPLAYPKMSIIKSVLVFGRGERTIGASQALALAGKPVHVFACWPSLSEMSQLEDIPNITALRLKPVSPSEVQTAQELVAKREDHFAKE